MEGKNPFAMEDNHGGHLPRQLRGNTRAGSFGDEEVEARANGQGYEDLRERWFRAENSHAEIRTLTHLDNDLNSSLLFEHGGR